MGGEVRGRVDGRVKDDGSEVGVPLSVNVADWFV